jgi:hypothetical protein
MLVRLESATEIAATQRQLEKTIRSAFRNQVRRDIGFPGDTYRNAVIHTDGAHWHNVHDGRTDITPRKLNWFGRMTPSGALNISVEINPPYRGRGGRVAGFFARDEASGELYLMHSGKVGGGTKGVGKFDFLAYSEIELLEVADSSGRSARAVPVLNIRDKRLRSLVRYLDQVDEFKSAVRAGETKKQGFRRRVRRYKEFYSEPRGRRRGRSVTFDYLSRHGDVVDALKLWRESQPLPKGARIVKSVLVDRRVERDDQLDEAYEAKTAVDRASLYAAIGQLIVHGGRDDCKRWIVLPRGKQIQPDIIAALDRLGIAALRFRLDKSGAAITP